jgi:hypothetical protein
MPNFGGESGIWTLVGPLEAVSYRCHVARVAADARVAVAPCTARPRRALDLGASNGFHWLPKRTRHSGLGAPRHEECREPADSENNDAIPDAFQLADVGREVVIIQTFSRSRGRFRPRTEPQEPRRPSTIRDPHAAPDSNVSVRKFLRSRRPR